MKALVTWGGGEGETGQQAAVGAAEDVGAETRRRLELKCPAAAPHQVRVHRAKQARQHQAAHGRQRQQVGAVVQHDLGAERKGGRRLGGGAAAGGAAARCRHCHAGWPLRYALVTVLVVLRSIKHGTGRPTLGRELDGEVCKRPRADAPLVLTPRLTANQASQRGCAALPGAAEPESTQSQIQRYGDAGEAPGEQWGAWGSVQSAQRAVPFDDGRAHSWRQRVDSPQLAAAALQAQLPANWPLHACMGPC